jgi:hypothetical protein
VTTLVHVLFDVADGALEVTYRLPGLAFCLQAAVASDLAPDLFRFATNLVFHGGLLVSESETPMCASPTEVVLRAEAKENQQLSQKYWPADFLAEPFVA